MMRKEAIAIPTALYSNCVDTIEVLLKIGRDIYKRLCMRFVMMCTNRGKTSDIHRRLG